VILGSARTPASDGPWWLDDWLPPPPEQVARQLDGRGLRVAILPSGAPALDCRHETHRDPHSGVAVAVYGELYNARELARALSLPADTPLGQLLVAGYDRFGVELVRRLNGGFVLVIADPGRDRVWIARDHLGVESLYFHRTADGVDFCSEPRPLAAAMPGGPRLNEGVLSRYLLLNYNPGFDTLYRGIEKLRPGHLLRVEEGRIQVEPYWRLSFRDPTLMSHGQYRDELRALMEDAVRIRLDAPPHRAGAYLSGGMDSSSVVALMNRQLDAPMHTFSFRCEVKSYDESVYARAVSDHCGTIHHEVPYDAAGARGILELARLQHEPLSDVGIEVGTFVLAHEASGTVDYVLTGDGGDELFAGHPVYAADRLAERFEALPRRVRNPLTAVLQRLPDSRHKKSLLVKARRFAYSVGFPAEFHSNRWRIYYKNHELRQLLSPDWRALLEGTDPLDPFRTIYGEADGPDQLSRTLYGDYQTVVDFYLRRMQVVRRLGCTARFPLLDVRLVEFAARIPSALKVTSDAATKFLLNEAMADIVPPRVLERKDKLGNSVPMKNWLRDSHELQALVDEYLSPDALRRRGLFEPGAVRHLWDRHRSGRENHSHRIWALLVFELWCRAHLDRPGYPAPGATSATGTARAGAQGL
jgi:asparagine synthase (glutamine-hydrolysing)